MESVDWLFYLGGLIILGMCFLIRFCGAKACDAREKEEHEQTNFERID